MKRHVVASVIFVLVLLSACSATQRATVSTPMEEVATEPRAGWQWYEYASEGETATYELPAGSEATYEASLDDYTVTYTIAYPQTWRVRSDAYTHGRLVRPC